METGYAELDGTYREVMCTADGDILPPCAWLVELGIDEDTAKRWAVDHLKGLVEAYSTECSECLLPCHHPSMSDGEMVLVAGVDMFLAGLALGLHRGVAGDDHA